MRYLDNQLHMHTNKRITNKMCIIVACFFFIFCFFGLRAYFIKFYFKCWHLTQKRFATPVLEQWFSTSGAHSLGKHDSISKGRRRECKNAEKNEKWKSCCFLWSALPLCWSLPRLISRYTPSDYYDYIRLYKSYIYAL